MPYFHHLSFLLQVGNTGLLLFYHFIAISLQHGHRDFILLLLLEMVGGERAGANANDDCL